MVRLDFDLLKIQSICCIHSILFLTRNSFAATYHHSKSKFLCVNQCWVVLIVQNHHSCLFGSPPPADSG